MTSIDCVWSAETILGEAPCWCPVEKVVYWVDIDGKKVLRYDPVSGDKRIFPQDYEFGCIVKRDGGGFAAATNVGLVHVNEALSKVDVFATPESEIPSNRFNDGKCDRKGRFWAGSTDINETDPTGALYRINGEGTVDLVQPDVIASNGLGWSPDNTTMYFTDTGHNVIYAYEFDLETGALGTRRDFVKVDEGNGYPDGLCVDAEGFVWSAHWDGWRLTRYDPDGNIDRVVEMPVPLVTSVAFGGDDLDRMYVTTARLDMTESQLQEAPLSGGLFVVDAGVKGLPDPAYKG